MTAVSRAAHTRSLGKAAVRAAYRVDVQGSELVPATGPLVIGIIGKGPVVGPLVATGLPRPIHIFGMPQALGGLSPHAGSREAREILDHGGAVGVPVNEPADRALAAFLALRARAPFLPLVVLGAHGKFEADPPRLRSMVRMVALPPITLPASGDPCAWPVVRDAAEQVRQVLADAERTVRRPLDQMGTS